MGRDVSGGVSVCVRLPHYSGTILLTPLLGDLAVESGILTPSQSEMFWSYRQKLIFYAADSLVHKIVVDLSRMVRVCLTNITPKKKAIEGAGKASRMAYGKDRRAASLNLFMYVGPRDSGSPRALSSVLTRSCRVVIRS